MGKYEDYGLASRDFIGPREGGDCGVNEDGSRRTGLGFFMGRWAPEKKVSAPTTRICQGYCVVKRVVIRAHNGIESSTSEYRCSACNRPMLARLNKLCGKEVTD